ncbi:MAG: DUF3054 domain-containing protein [Actinomycetia bacterium]|nr:DUF3054 domain-containing protein [Actinomycetes bacterium]
MRRWFWVLDASVIISFAFIGSDFHGFTFDFAGILGISVPFLMALAGGIFVLRAWIKPLSILNGFLLAVISLTGGMLLRHYVWGDGTARTFIIVAGAYFIALMVGWRLVALGVAWLAGRSRNASTAT